ncbi:MAG: hypothetical protein PHE48_02370 [Candidatus Daviesbacteria bacterium]|nr:hypothetical protein [Candidatus Daviesbacteria bacterium]
MSYRYRSRRSTRRLARKSRRNFIVTLVIIIFLIYATLNWVLPYFIGSVGVIKNIIKPPQALTPKSAQNASLAPPVLNIPFEATNSAQIDIQGFASPGSRVRLYIDGESLQTVDVSSEGSFTFANVTLYLGINNIYGTTLDEQEKESLPSKTIKLIYDSEKPSLIVSEPEDNKKIQGGDRKVKVSGKTEPGAKVFVNNTQAIVNGDGSFTIDQSLNDGDNTISIKAQDSALNQSEVQRIINYSP